MTLKCVLAIVQVRVVFLSLDFLRLIEKLHDMTKKLVYPPVGEEIYKNSPLLFNWPFRDQAHRRILDPNCASLIVGRASLPSRQSTHFRSMTELQKNISSHVTTHRTHDVQAINFNLQVKQQPTLRTVCVERLLFKLRHDVDGVLLYLFLDRCRRQLLHFCYRFWRIAQFSRWNDKSKTQHICNCCPSAEFRLVRF